MNTSLKNQPPLVAIAGRPNVGKSTLFNRLLGRRVAIVHYEPGTTRDRIYGDVEWQNCHFQLVDTGGLLPGKQVGLGSKVLEQAELAIREADLCLLVVDVQEGLTPLDSEVAQLLHQQGKPVVVAVNKADNAELALGESEFSQLGFETSLPVSALHGLGIGELLRTVVQKVPFFPVPSEIEKTAIAIVGRPNVGKSTLVNRLVGEERVVVDEEPGTTRDAVDTPFHWNGKEFVLIDTAGLRKKTESQSALECFSLSRTRRSIARSDVVLLLIETHQAPTRVDAQFIQFALEKGKSCIISVNKWDLAGSLSKAKCREGIQFRFAYAGFLPIIFFSALKDRSFKKLMELCDYVAGQRRQTIHTAVINRVLHRAQERVSPPRKKGKKFKIYYATQVKTSPPVFRLFVNDPQLLVKNYETYLINSLYRAFGFEGTPLRFELRKRVSRKR